jgi:hypothetical protein
VRWILDRQLRRRKTKKGRLHYSARLNIRT